MTINNKISFCIFLLAITITNGVYASKIDSLKQQLLKVADNKKAEIYNHIYKLGKNHVNTDSTLHFARKALSFAQKHNIEYQEGLAYKNIGKYYLTIRDFDEAIINFNKAISIFTKINHYKRLIYSYHDLAHTYSNKKEFIKASEYLYIALQISEKNNFTQGTIDILNGIGLVNRILGEYDKAMKHFKKALYLEEGSIDPHKKTITKITGNIALTLWNKKEYDQALYYFKKELILQEELNNIRGMMLANNYIGIVYGGKEEHKHSLYHYKEALKYAKALNSDYLICAAQLNIGEELWFLKEYQKAIKILKQALKTTKRLELVEWERNGSQHLFECYEKLGDYKNAFKYHKNFKILNDSLKIEESKLKLVDLETKYETDKKEKQIEILNKENEIQELKLKRSRKVLILSLALIILLFSSAFGYFRYLKHKQRTAELIKKQNHEKQLLSTIISTEDKERKRFASDLHDGLGPLLSSIKLYLSGMKEVDEKERIEMMDYTTELIDESIKSVRIISNNILPVELSENGLVSSIKNFSNKVQLSKQIEIDLKDETNNKRFDSSTELILYRVIQELINNSIKHSSAKNININFLQEKDKLGITYIDNGIGFDIEKQMNNSEGIGLKNIHERINSLQGSIKFMSETGDGTKVIIRLLV